MTNMHARVLSDGQLKVSKEILELLRASEGEDLDIITDGSKVIILPARSISNELRGSIKADKSRIKQVLSLETWDD